jgi:predicted transcriptional regulator
MSYKNFPKDCCSGCKFKKREEISLNKYGVKNSAQRQDVKSKLSSLNFEDYFSQIVELAQKGFSAYKIAEKLQLPITSLNRYIESKKIDVIKNNRNITTTNALLDKHGSKYREILSKRLSDTSKKLYQVDNFFQSEDIKQKSKETCTKKYESPFWIQNEQNKKDAKQNELKSKADSGSIRLYNGMTLSNIAEKIGISKSHFISLYNKYGLDYVLSYEKSITNIEKLIKTFLEEINIPYEYNKKFFNYYPDFVIDNVVVECDGLYWHSDAVQMRNNYHFSKRNFYKGVQKKPLFFRSNEIENKFPIVCSIIKNALRLNSNKIFARKCEAVEISMKEALEFCEDNHLMGGFKSPTHSIGLFHEDVLVSVFQVKQLKKGSGEYDLSRYCTLPDTSITGGFSKMLSFFEKMTSPSKLQTFVDMRYGDGDYLQNLGFHEESCHLSFQWTDGLDTFHRMKFKGNSGYEAGLFKIWDCGQRKMVKTY